MDHYAELGVTRFLIKVHEQPDKPLLYEEVEAVARDFRNVSLEAVRGDWIAVQNDFLNTLSQKPDDWFIVVDHDEFHLFPERHALLLFGIETGLQRRLTVLDGPQLGCGSPKQFSQPCLRRVLRMCHGQSPAWDQHDACANPPHVQNFTFRSA